MAPGMPLSCWKGPGLCQKRKPMGSLPGTPPEVIMIPSRMSPKIVTILMMENQNSAVGQDGGISFG